MPDIYLLYLLLSGANLVWLVGLTAYTWLRKPGQAAAEALTAMKKELADAMDTHRQQTALDLRAHDLKIAQIEAHMQHLPTAEQVAHLEGVAKGIATRVDGVSAAVNRIESYLLSKN